MEAHSAIPESGQIVRVRQGLYLVKQVIPPINSDDSTLARLSCLDNDGERLKVPWEAAE